MACLWLFDATFGGSCTDEKSDSAGKAVTSYRVPVGKDTGSSMAAPQHRDKEVRLRLSLGLGAHVYKIQVGVRVRSMRIIIMNVGCRVVIGLGLEEGITELAEGEEGITELGQGEEGITELGQGEEGITELGQGEEGII